MNCFWFWLLLLWRPMGKLQWAWDLLHCCLCLPSHRNNQTRSLLSDQSCISIFGRGRWRRQCLKQNYENTVVYYYYLHCNKHKMSVCKSFNHTKITKPNVTETRPKDTKTSLYTQDYHRFTAVWFFHRFKMADICMM